MPVTPSYPGVYIEEVPSGVRTIAGVSTSVTAFVGTALCGPVDDPRVLGSFDEFERLFGGLWVDSMMSYAVRSFFLNGGSQAIVVRVVHSSAAVATVTHGDLKLKAKSPGACGNRVRIRVEHLSDTKLYTLRVRDTATGFEERFIVSTDGASPLALQKVLLRSSLVEPNAAAPAARPAPHDTPADLAEDPFRGTVPSKQFDEATGGKNGDPVSDTELTGKRGDKTGVYALLRLENQLFNILNIPPLSRADNGNVGTSTLTEALALCVEKRAMLLVDPLHTWKTVADAVTAMPAFPLSGEAARNAALYFPRLRMPDPLQEGRLDSFAPGGAVAGVMARTDVQRGVWKAPAGQDATLTGVPELALNMTDLENGRLNPLGLNCLRAFPVIGRVVWGARTLRGADQLPNDWKYVPVRRLALFIEESLYQGTQWVVFEPNDEPLWAQIRLNVGAFMQGLFRQGAFQGRSAREAYLVKCDKETTTQADINLGIVNIIVGFAPLKPAEFVILKIQQIAGQIET
jgi:phage tail sheath protein FI